MTGSKESRPTLFLKHFAYFVPCCAEGGCFVVNQFQETAGRMPAPPAIIRHSPSRPRVRGISKTDCGTTHFVRSKVSGCGDYSPHPPSLYPQEGLIHLLHLPSCTYVAWPHLGQIAPPLTLLVEVAPTSGGLGAPAAGAAGEATSAIILSGKGNSS